MTIYLYIKQCTHCQLKYFGKTIQNPHVYKGSGDLWLRHIKKYGRLYVITIDIFEFNNQEEATTFALNFSIKNNIVESKEWANLINEDAKGGWPIGTKHTEKTKQHLSEIKSGKNHPLFGTHISKETRIKMSKARKIKPCQGKNNPRYDPKIYTFINKDGRKFIGTKFEMISKHKEEKLLSTVFTRIIKGKQKQQKGWVVLTDTN